MAQAKIQTLSPLLPQLLAGVPLSGKQAYQIFHALFSQKLTESEAKSLLLLLARRGETPDEVAGCIKALRDLEKPTSMGAKIMDTCGTGGDASHSINISTIAAFVVAGAGVKVAKHGNRSISSRCGSSDLMVALGVNLNAAPKKMFAAIQKCGIGYFHAPNYHPVFSRVQSLRQKIKMRTIFNLLGPLVNPVRLDYQLLGVGKSEYLNLFASILSQRSMRCALICHGAGGLDEISLSGPSQLIWIQRNKMRKEILNPCRYGFKLAPPKAIRGGTIMENRRVAFSILSTKKKGTAPEAVVLLNAAAALKAAEATTSFKTAIEKARQSLYRGYAYQALQELIRISNS